MKKNIEISVIIPAYNSENTIERCLKSVCEQSLEEIEIIVIDDGSKDNTSKIVNKVALSDQRIRYIKKENGGVSSARNLGLEMAQGKYIAFLDSDDYVLPNIYTVMLSCMADNVDMVISGFKIVDNGNERTVRPSKQAVECKDWRSCFSETFTRYLWNTPWNKLFRHNKISHKFDINKHFGEDLKFILDYVSVGAGVQYCDEILYVNDTSNEKSLSKNWGNKICEECQNHLIIGNFLEKHSIPYDSAMSDYLLSALWVTVGKAITLRYGRSIVKKFVTFEDALRTQISNYKPQKLVNKITLAVVKQNYIVLNYLVLSMFGLMSECKNKRK